MNRLRFGHSGRGFLPRALFHRRWLLACSFLVIVPALLLFGVATRGSGVEPPVTASISVNASAGQIQGYINPLLFGHNVCFAEGDNVPINLWDPNTDNLTEALVDNPAKGATVKSRIRDLSPTILRFPGGKVSDWYFWDEGLDRSTLFPDVPPRKPE
jgi:hypothetical protein